MNQRGFSLMEVLIGLVVLAVALLSIGGMQLASVRGSHFSSDLTQATVLAQNKLEELKNLPYSDPKLKNPSSAQQITVSGIVYTVLYTVTAPGNWMKLITTDVRWMDRGDHRVTLSTIKSR